MKKDYVSHVKAVGHNMPRQVIETMAEGCLHHALEMMEEEKVPFTREINFKVYETIDTESKVSIPFTVVEWRFSITDTEQDKSIKH